MPEIPFKLFIYLLLQVNREPSNGCDVGEGWITYRMIKDACCKPNKQWADSTISRALDYLEGNNNDGPDGKPEVYIKRIQTKKGGPQKIRVVNFRKYQVLTSSFVQEVTEGTSSPTQEVYETSSIMQEVQKSSRDAGLRETSCIKQEPPLAQPLALALEKQDIYREVKRKEEEAVMFVAEWARWYAEHFPIAPSWRDFADMQDLKEQGVTDDLIIALLEEALANPRVKRPLAWAKRRISDMFPRGIRTAEDYRRWKQTAEDESRGALPERKQQARQPQRRGDDEAIREVKEALLRLQHEQQ